MAFTSQHSELDDSSREANCLLPTSAGPNMSNALSYVGEQRGGYMVVDKLVYVGEFQEAFSMDEESQSSSLQQLGSRYCNKATLCRMFVNGLVLLLLLSLLCGVALLIPAVSGTLDKGVPLKQSRSLDFIAENAPTGEEGEARGCDETCGKRIRFAAKSEFQGTVGSCLEALMAVKSTGVCTSCTLWNDGCHEKDIRKASDEPKVTTKAPTSLRAHRKNTALSSSTTKALETMPESAHAYVAKYDCESGFFNCVYSWTIEKKRWCTTNSQRACPLYDCNIGFDECFSQWSDSQKKWCQLNRVDRNCVMMKK